MNIQQFYEALEVDYNIIKKRLRKDELIEKYLHMIIEDTSFACLKAAVEKKDYVQVFKAAHTIKGMALNLELVPLVKASANLSDYLKNCSCSPENSTIVDEMSLKIIEEYENIQNLVS